MSSEVGSNGKIIVGWDVSRAEGGRRNLNIGPFDNLIRHEIPFRGARCSALDGKKRSDCSTCGASTFNCGYAEFSAACE